MLALRVRGPLLKHADADDKKEEKEDDYGTGGTDRFIKLQTCADGPVQVCQFGELKEESTWEQIQTRVKSSARQVRWKDMRVDFIDDLNVLPKRLHHDLSVVKSHKDFPLVDFGWLLLIDALIIIMIISEVSY